MRTQALQPIESQVYPPPLWGEARRRAAREDERPTAPTWSAAVWRSANLSLEYKQLALRRLNQIRDEHTRCSSMKQTRAIP